jgi:hypothetical protein
MLLSIELEKFTKQRALGWRKETQPTLSIELEKFTKQNRLMVFGGVVREKSPAVERGTNR